ncbi:MAG: UvrD-helicase domain-containing protein [Deltaproteobacteria bacterium]|nr:UvrD-helicase domain-containing protein [Deltaproteobacteria bacterium]
MATIRLNQAQRAAVEHDLGPLLVLAGAGSGKTGVVTRRIARLIKRGVPAAAILAMTFTNRAAAEMRERVVRSLGQRATEGLRVCTFHRFGLEVLSREARALGLRGGRFAIYDQGDCLGVLRTAMRNLVAGRNYDLGAVLNRISLAKNAFVDAEGYATQASRSEDEYDEITALIFPRYQATLQGLQAFDFDDLVCEPVRLWRRRDDVLERWRMRFRYVIVDEYQDTNAAQLAMLRLLCAEHRNLCVVGDDDQAIYAWRGADVGNILDFDKHFPGTKVVRLERNYRSTAAVLDVANAVLAASSARRHEKKLIPTQGAGEPVQSITLADGTAEARFIADQAHELISSGVARARDIGVLYRSNLQAGEIESELAARGVPYQLFGGTQTFDRKEVKDVLAYLTAALEPFNELAVRRSLTYPPRGVGDASLRKLASHATLGDGTLLDSALGAHAVAGLNDSGRQGCRSYGRIITELNRRIDGSGTAAETTSWLVGAMEIKAAIFAESGQNNKAAGRRWSNVQHLVKAIARREDGHILDREGLGQYLRMLVLRENDEDAGDVADRVTLTTMHGAKGLEYAYVFLVGLEEGFLPHARSVADRATDVAPTEGPATDEIEQERRLFYVAITRARRQLWLCRAKARLGRGKLQKRVPSRFLLQIPEELLVQRDLDEPAPADIGVAQRGARDVLAAILGAGSDPKSS